MFSLYFSKYDQHHCTGVVIYGNFKLILFDTVRQFCKSIILFMKRILILLLTAVVLSSNDCVKNDPLCGNDSHDVLTIKNNSNKRISYAFEGYYPDTTIIGDHNPAYYSQSYIISPGGSYTDHAGRAGCFESIFSHNTKQWICFFDQDSLEQIP